MQNQTCFARRLPRRACQVRWRNTKLSIMLTAYVLFTLNLLLSFVLCLSFLSFLFTSSQIKSHISCCTDSNATSCLKSMMLSFSSAVQQGGNQWKGIFPPHFFFWKPSSDMLPARPQQGVLLGHKSPGSLNHAAALLWPFSSPWSIFIFIQLGRLMTQDTAPRLTFSYGGHEWNVTCWWGWDMKEEGWGPSFTVDTWR